MAEAGQTGAGQSRAGAQRCYRHPDRDAYIRCQRCDQLICPDCMREASVGFQCPACIAEGNKNVRRPRTRAGGRVQTRGGVVTLSLIGINVAVFVLTDVLRLPVIDALGVMAARDVFDGSNVYPGVDSGGYWRLLTSAFLHAGILHLLFNMIALYLFGTFAEQQLGRGRYLAAYVTGAVGSSVFVYWLSDPSRPTVGASGAIFAILGMTLMLLIAQREDVRGLVVLLLINAVISTQGNISWQGHLGGFVMGVLMGAVFAFTPRPRQRWAQAAMWVALWAAIVVGIALRSITLAT